MGKRDLNAWIAEQRAQKRWVQPCPSCGTWFSVERAGRRAILCALHRCQLFRKYQSHNGRAPPAWLQAKWREQYGDAPRTSRPKKAGERRCAA